MVNRTFSADDHNLSKDTISREQFKSTNKALATSTDSQYDCNINEDIRWHGKGQTSQKVCW